MAATVTRNCPKCTGTGYLAIYAGIAAGVCFPCNGEGTIQAPADWREREARNARRRQTANARRAAAGANARLWAEFIAAHPTEAAIIDAGRATNRDLDMAYGQVATYREYDSNPRAALAIIANHLAGRI
jgi:hypothetical protein